MAALMVWVQVPVASAQATYPYPAQGRSADPAYGTVPAAQPTAQPYPAPSPSTLPRQYPYRRPGRYRQPSTAPAGYPAQQPGAAPAGYPTQQPAATPAGYPAQQPAATPAGYPAQQVTQVPASTPSYRQPYAQSRTDVAARPVPWPQGYYGAPPVLPYRDGEPIPPGYRLEGTGGTGLVVAGLLIGGAVYGAGLIVAANSGFENGTTWLAVPVIGPWAAIMGRKIDTDLDVLEVVDNKVTKIDPTGIEDAATDYVRNVAFLTGAGIFQAVGLTLLLLGLASRDYQLVRYDLAGLELRPIRVGPDGIGLDAIAAF